MCFCGVCVCVNVFACTYKYLQRPEESVGYPVDRVMGVCKSRDLGVKSDLL